MSLILDRVVKLIFLVGPDIGFVAFLVALVAGRIGPEDLLLTFIYFLLGGVGITIGFHRYATHAGFEACLPVKVILLLLGSMTIEGSVFFWVANHIKHHDKSDSEGDPHSPWFGFRDTLRGRICGLIHAHFGWLFDKTDPDLDTHVPIRLAQDPVVAFIDKTFILWTILAIAIPVLLQGGEKGILCALAAASFRHHITWSVNSICHVWGKRPFQNGDMSTNNVLVGILGLGEGWHNNHHAFPTSPFHGLRKWEIDFSGYVIRGLERVGLIWKVWRPDPRLVAYKREAALVS